MNSAASLFSKLKTTAFRAQHDNRVSLQVFPDLDVERISTDLNLVELGTQRGEIQHPVSNSSSFDEVEMRVVERITSEQKSAYSKLMDEITIQTERLNSIDIESRFAEIRQAANNVQIEFRSAAAQGRDDLNALRRQLKEAETEKNDFQAKHGVTRAARVKSTTSQILSVCALAFLLLIETWLNGTFLAAGSDQGLVGGFSQAFAFALLNVLGCWLIAFFGVRQLANTSPIGKLVGLAAAALFLIFALSLNLGLAHFREAAELGPDAGRVVMRRLTLSPFELSDITSWAFFGFGLLCSIGSFIDGLIFSDPLPGYANVESRRMQAHNRYIETKSNLLSDLSDIKDDANQELKDAQRDLNVRKNYYDTTLASRSQTVQLFRSHEQQLENAANLLLQRYREANQIARKTKPPKYFSKPWLVTPAVVAFALEDQNLRAALHEKIEHNQSLINGYVDAIYREYSETVAMYRQIDDLVDDDGFVAARINSSPSVPRDDTVPVGSN